MSLFKDLVDNILRSEPWLKSAGQKAALPCEKCKSRPQGSFNAMKNIRKLKRNRKWVDSAFKGP